MKHFKKKIFIISSPVACAVPIFLIASCSNNASNLAASSNESLYSNLWTISLIEDQIQNSIFNTKIEDIEKKINESLKNDSKNDFIMKVYVFYILWNAFKNPYNANGQIHQNLSSEINDYRTMLEDKMKPDNKNETSDEDKTYNNFKNYINTFDYKISIISLKNESIDKTMTLKESFGKKGLYLLNFKIDFWTSDEDTNKKIISQNNTNSSIILKTKMSSQQRQTINKIRNSEVKELTKNNFLYQSSKIYFNIEKKQFSSIVLPSNISYSITENTPNSGFAPGDKQRKLFSIDWYYNSNNLSRFETYINLRLDDTNNFNTTMSSDWTNFLLKEKIINEDKKINAININLNMTFNVDEDLLKEQE